MMEENNKSTIKFKSHIILPIIFVLTLSVAICMIALDDFTDGLNPLVIWLYFIVGMLYIGISTFDLFVNKERSKKTKIFISVFISLTFICEILYLIFYLIVKG